MLKTISVITTVAVLLLAVPLTTDATVYEPPLFVRDILTNSYILKYLSVYGPAAITDSGAEYYPSGEIKRMWIYLDYGDTTVFEADVVDRQYDSLGRLAYSLVYVHEEGPDLDREYYRAVSISKYDGRSRRVLRMSQTIWEGDKTTFEADVVDRRYDSLRRLVYSLTYVSEKGPDLDRKYYRCVSIDKYDGRSSRILRLSQTIWEDGKTVFEADMVDRQYDHAGELVYYMKYVRETGPGLDNEYYEVMAVEGNSLYHKYVKRYDMDWNIIREYYYREDGSMMRWNPKYDEMMWGLKKVNAEDAWKLSTGEGVTVAVVDTGIDYTHPDIDDNLWSNDAELHGLPGVDDDKNGYIDDIIGWDFGEGDNDLMDVYGHGTHVSGIAAAEGDSSDGIAGLAFDAKVMAVKIERNYSLVTSAVSKAIRYAVDMGARVINCSFGGGSFFWCSMVDAVEYAYRKGVIIVAAGGNGGYTDLTYPARSDYTVAVGATDRQDVSTDWSNRGYELDVAAPGVEILSLRSSQCMVPDTMPDELYFLASGTSMSSPFVAGLAALMISQNPRLSYEDFIRRLRFSCYDAEDPGWDRGTGWGRIDAFKALSYDWYDSGAVKSRWFMEPDAFNVLRYDYFEAGGMRGLLLASPGPSNIREHSTYLSRRLETERFFSPDLKGNLGYTYYNEDFRGGTGRVYATDTAAGVEIKNCAYDYGGRTVLMQSESWPWPDPETIDYRFYYDAGLDNRIAAQIEIEFAGRGEGEILSGDSFRLTRFDYDSPPNRTAWFLWGDDVYEGYDNVVIERRGVGAESAIKLPFTAHSPVLSRDGERLYVCNAYYYSFTNAVSVINTRDFSIEKMISIPQFPSRIAVTPDGHYMFLSIGSVAGIGGSYAMRIDLVNSANPLVWIHINYPGDVAVSPDGQNAYFYSKRYNTVSIVDADRAVVIKNINLPTPPDYYIPASDGRIAMHPGSAYAYVSNGHLDYVAVIDMAAMELVKTIDIGKAAGEVSFSPSGDRAFVACGASGILTVINTADNTVTASLSLGGNPGHVAVHPGGGYAYVSDSAANTVTVVDLSDYTVEKVLSVAGNPGQILFAPDGSRALVSCRTANAVTVINAADNTVEKTISLDMQAGEMVMMPDGSSAFVGGISEYSGPPRSDILASMTKINMVEEWNAYYGFDPDTENPANVIDDRFWRDNLIGPVDDPAGLGLPSDLPDWWQWAIDNGVVPEFPALSSDYTYDNNRVARKVDHNPYMDTTYDFTWDYESAGHVRADMSYDYDGDGDNDLVLSRVYNNGADYDIENMYSWEIISESKYLSGVEEENDTGAGIVVKTPGYAVPLPAPAPDTGSSIEGTFFSPELDEVAARKSVEAQALEGSNTNGIPVQGGMSRNPRRIGIYDHLRDLLSR